MIPAVGLKPKVPQKEAGLIIDPLVCEPTASGTWPAATAAADPDEDPPGVCAGLTGLRVAAGCLKASSVVTVLPMITAPSA